jgi:tRNA(Ile)-lysidine synthase
MASSRKRPSASKTVAVGLSGGVDSVVLLDMWRRRAAAERFPLQAIHVHHGLSPNADRWAEFCRRLCKRLGVPLVVKKVKVVKRGQGREAAAREARYGVFKNVPVQTLVLAHHLDDQAETVLMNLLRGAGLQGASGMRRESRAHGKTLLRPLLDVPREAILAYAREHGLEWIEDESNADESLTRNFVRRRLAPLLDERFPSWKYALARAARHFSRREAGAQDLLRKFLQTKGLRAPSEAKLVEMLKQLTARGSRTLIEHDGARLRVYRGKIVQEKSAAARVAVSLAWKGESRLKIAELGGELRFRRARGKGIAASATPLRVRLREGGERLQPDPRRPRRTLKNLFQEAGVPPWERDRLPLLTRGDDVVWVPGLGVDVKYRAAKNASGILPEWRKMAG